MILLELMRLPEYTGRSACDFRVTSQEPDATWQVYGGGGVWLNTEHAVTREQEPSDKSKPLPGCDDWKLDNGPYENDGEPGWFSDAYDQYMMGLEDRAREQAEPEEEED